MNRSTNHLVRLLVGCAAAGGLLALPTPARAQTDTPPTVPAPVPIPVPLPGFFHPVRVAATSGSGNATAKTATVACPAGTQVAGAGVEFGISDSAADVWPTEIRPHRTLTEVTVSALADRPAAWSVTAVAVCARPRVGHDRVTSTVTVTSGDSKTAYASCPAGTKVIGTGFEITGDAAGSGATVSRIMPNANLSHVAVTAAVTGDAPPWGLQAYAICSSVQSATLIGPDSAAFALLADGDDGCPPGTSLNGVGAELFDYLGNPTDSGWITGLAPDESLDEPDATADWWYASGTTDAHGICVPDTAV